jgi:membrane-associated protein
MLSFLHTSLPDLIQTIGYVGVFIVVFCESGMPFGFLFPGESFLFTAGFLASQGTLSIGLLCITVSIAAILGDSAGYWLGKKFGPALFTKDDSFFFKKEHVTRTHDFYEKYGSRAIILARFVPVIRSFVPILAGVGKMRYRTFVSYNVIGALAWGTGVPLIGYYLGRSVPNAEQYLLPIILVIIVLSFAPIVFELVQHHLRSKKK